MGEALDRYRMEVCAREGHAHGLGEPETLCLLDRLSRTRQKSAETESQGASPTVAWKAGPLEVEEG